MQATLFERDIIMDIIIDVYNAMDDRDVASWCRKEAEKVVADQILIDRQHGLDPLPYDAEDFYDTIHYLILMDYGRLRLLFLQLRRLLRR